MKIYKIQLKLIFVNNKNVLFKITFHIRKVQDTSKVKVTYFPFILY